MFYRCEIRRGRALPAHLADHPATVYVNETAVLDHLDGWIESFADPEWLAESQATDPAGATRLAGMRARLVDLDRKIANLVVAIEDGGDAKLLTGQLAQRSAERDALKVRMITAEPTFLTSEQITAIVQGLGGITEALKSATAQERAAIYESLAIRLTYDDRTNQIRATSDRVCRGGCRRGDQHLVVPVRPGGSPTGYGTAPSPDDQVRRTSLGIVRTTTVAPVLQSMLCPK